MLSIVLLLAALEGPVACDPAERYVCRIDHAAYEHALRECQIMASKGEVYHALGCAKGTRYSGVGRSWGVAPRHCYSDLPEERLVARAYVITESGARYWSAHYK